MSYQGRKCKLIRNWYDEAGVLMVRIQFLDNGEQLVVYGSALTLEVM